MELGESWCNAILLFHALSGCDVSSAMYGIGKKKAWFAWETMGDVLTQVFITLQTNPTSFTIDSELMVVLQRYHIIQFDPKCECNLVNEARKIMFTNRLKPLESIPPTKHALFQHIKRSILIAYEWSHSLEKQTLNLSPSDYGWVWNERLEIWMPHWSDLPDVSEGCALLISCKCKVSCKGRCKCYQNNLKCTSLCKCQDMCFNNEEQ